MEHLSGSSLSGRPHLTLWYDGGIFERLSIERQLSCRVRGTIGVVTRCLPHGAVGTGFRVIQYVGITDIKGKNFFFGKSFHRRPHTVLPHSLLFTALAINLIDLPPHILASFPHILLLPESTSIYIPSTPRLCSTFATPTPEHRIRDTWFVILPITCLHDDISTSRTTPISL